MKKPITVVGFDQGYANLGMAILSYYPELKTYKIEKVYTIVTSSKLTIDLRLLMIYKEIKLILKNYSNIKYAGCEQLFFNAKQKNGRNKSASIMYTNMASGILFLLCAEKKITIKNYAPTSVKKALTGNGRATKEELETCLNSILKEQNIIINTNHESDAICIAITLIEKELKGDIL